MPFDNLFSRRRQQRRPQGGRDSAPLPETAGRETPDANDAGETSAGPTPEEQARGDIAEYLAGLKNSEVLGPLVTCHATMPPEEAVFAGTARPWPAAMADILERLSIKALYHHQGQAIDLLRAGHDVIVATPTASGKSLIYTLPVLERFLQDPEARSLFLFPLKALAQDQLSTFKAMTGHWPRAARPEAAIYDGDTSDHFRRKIRENPPHVLMSNPEMLHLSLLPHHHLWSCLFAGLTMVVVDEAHTYRGVLGSHMAQVFRRLLRLCALYGARPQFVFCSATVGNPAELAASLTGRPAQTVLENGAPRGKRHYLFLNPPDSPAGTAIRLLKAALARGLRTIVYCQSRRMTELISLWAQDKSGPYSQRISAYRAGFLPEERRAVEARMASGELLAVISTSALELGIDIGHLDLCILVGYPGTVMATMQRGGRVGRNAQESAVILVAQEDALDQYIVRHPQDFFSRPPEKAVLNPDNPVILARHLECAAAELPLKPHQPPDAGLLSAETAKAIAALEKNGLLLRSADGQQLLAARKRPQHELSLRGGGRNVTIEDENGALIGAVDGVRALREAHPGAIYLHLGRYYEISELDLACGRARARRCQPPWFTRSRGHKETQILTLEESAAFGGLALQRGRLRITEHISGYEKRALKNRQLLGVTPLDLPPQIFESEGLWLQVPPSAQRLIERGGLHFMGSIHALEHAAIGILPLLVMSDRNDFGGISTPMHMQTGRPTVFVYDALPGGAGLCRAAFAQGRELFEHVRRVIADCPCELGCPSCVHSPKCGSGNRPIDKQGALSLLLAMLEDNAQKRAEAAHILEKAPSGLQNPDEEAETARPAAAETPDNRKGKRPEALEAAGLSAPPAGAEFQGRESAPPGFPAIRIEEPVPPGPDPALTAGPFVALDVETRRSAAEVGGWHKAGAMGVSVAVLYDSRNGLFTAYGQEEIPQLVEILRQAPLIVGFNLLRFDYQVLEAQAGGVRLGALPTLDMLERVRRQLSYRVSLDNLARATLGAPKSADGLQALQWWKERRLDLIEEYCRRDVAITRDLFLFGRENKYLLFTNKAGQAVRVRADW